MYIPADNATPTQKLGTYNPDKAFTILNKDLQTLEKQANCSMKHLMQKGGNSLYLVNATTVITQSSTLLINIWRNKHLRLILEEKLRLNNKINQIISVFPINWLEQCGNLVMKDLVTASKISKSHSSVLRVQYISVRFNNITFTMQQFTLLETSLLKAAIKEFQTYCNYKNLLELKQLCYKISLI